MPTCWEGAEWPLSAWTPGCSASIPAGLQHPRCPHTQPHVAQHQLMHVTRWAGRSWPDIQVDLQTAFNLLISDGEAEGRLCGAPVPCVCSITSAAAVNPLSCGRHRAVLAEGKKISVWPSLPSRRRLMFPRACLRLEPHLRAEEEEEECGPEVWRGSALLLSATGPGLGLPHLRGGKSSTHAPVGEEGRGRGTKEG